MRINIITSQTQVFILCHHGLKYTLKIIGTGLGIIVYSLYILRLIILDYMLM